MLFCCCVNFLREYGTSISNCLDGGSWAKTKLLVLCIIRYYCSGYVLRRPHNSYSELLFYIVSNCAHYSLAILSRKREVAGFFHLGCLAIANEWSTGVHPSYFWRVAGIQYLCWLSFFLKFALLSNTKSNCE